MDDLQVRLGKAVKHFWKTRDRQAASQGKTGRKDAGLRTAVTGGKHHGLCKDSTKMTCLTESSGAGRPCAGSGNSQLFQRRQAESTIQADAFLRSRDRQSTHRRQRTSGSPGSVVFSAPMS